MKMTPILAAAIIAGSTSLAMAQAGGAGAGGAGSDVSTPRKGQTSPNPASPPAARRGDDMPAGMNAMPMQQNMQKAGMKKGKKMKKEM